MLIRHLALTLILFTSMTASEPTIVGIAGGTGSGKTTVAREIQEALQGQVTIVSQDSYYRDISHLSMEERNQTNFDHPSALDFDLMQRHLSDLKQGRAVDIPVYDFCTHSRTNQTVRVEPTDTLIVEGILLFAIPEVREQFDIKIFVDTDHDVRILRRVQRDIDERGRTFASVHKQYLESVRPMHEQFVEPSKKFADVIIPDGGHNKTAIDMIVSRLKA